MSFDLYQKEVAERMSTLQPTTQPEVGAFDGFVRGVPGYAARAGVEAWRAVDLLGSVGPIVQDDFTGGTEAQDKYFKEHDVTFGKMLDYVTPRPEEVGTATKAIGTAIGSIPIAIVAPELLIGSAYLSPAEDLVNQGVDSTKAQAVGAVQSAGMALGLYMPVLGKTLTQRMLLGGAGFNVAQGAVTRGVSGKILEGTPAEDQFKAFDPEMMTIDTLLGAAFGGMAHLSPSQREHGAKMIDAMTEWGKSLKPSDVDALAVLRQAQHTNVDTLPGNPVDISDMNDHVAKIKKAIEQVLRDEPVDVSDMPSGKFEPIPGRLEEAQKHGDWLLKESDRIRKEEGLPEFEGPPVPRAEPPPLGEELARPLDTSKPGEADPVATAADRIADENPDFHIHVGKDAEGNPITKTARQYLDDVRASSALARQDSKLFQIAAECIIGSM